jgi:prophage DNA circulation protein
MPTEASGWILVHDMSVLRLELDTIAEHWQRALDADQRALAAAAGILPALELVGRQSELRLERLNVAAALARLAQVVR